MRAHPMKVLAGLLAAVSGAQADGSGKVITDIDRRTGVGVRILVGEGHGHRFDRDGRHRRFDRRFDHRIDRRHADHRHGPRSDRRSVGQLPSLRLHRRAAPTGQLPSLRLERSRGHRGGRRFGGHSRGHGGRHAPSHRANMPGR